MKNLAFLFPGQGSQSVGMMEGFADDAIVKATFQEASDTLGINYWDLVAVPNEILNLTQHTQPLMLTAGVAIWRAYLKTGGPMPAVVAGHSLGEYTALVAAEALSFKDALPLVRFRAEVMRTAVPQGQGAMAAILGLEDDAVREVCAEAAQSEVCEAVNLNCPGQVVIAGDAAAVARAMELAKTKGAKRALPLPVSVPSHCALMQPAAEKLAKYLSTVTVNVPKIKVIHNTDVSSHSAPEAIKQALVKQLHSPVRWVETVQALHQSGITLTAECGPGKVLSGLVKRIVPELPCVAMTSPDTFAEIINPDQQEA